MHFGATATVRSNGSPYMLYGTLALSVYPVCLWRWCIAAKQLDGSIATWYTEVGLGPGDIALDRDPAPPRKGAQQPPLFGPCLLWPNGHPSQQLLSFCCSISRRKWVETWNNCCRFRLKMWRLHSFSEPNIMHALVIIDDLRHYVRGATGWPRLCFDRRAFVCLWTQNVTGKFSRNVRGE